MSESLQELVGPHIDSFDVYFSEGLFNRAVESIQARVIVDAEGNRLRYWLEDVQFSKPILNEKEKFSLERNIYPVECRQRGITYGGQLSGSLAYQVNEGPIIQLKRNFGICPIMVRSKLCHLHNLDPSQLLRYHEEATELGGYFIVNGIERLVRLLIVQRRNHPLALHRSSYIKKGPGWTPWAILIRCVSPLDNSKARSITLHYLQDGQLMIRVSWRKQEYMIPMLLILRALKDITDKQIYDGIVGFTDDSSNDEWSTFVRTHADILLRSMTYSQPEGKATRYDLATRKGCLAFLGSQFSAVMRHDDTLSEEQLGQYMLNELVLIHLDRPADKANFLLLLARKLFQLVGGFCRPDNPDSPMHHELLLSGFLYGMYVTEKLDEFLTTIKVQLGLEITRNKLSFTGWSLNDSNFKKLLTTKCATVMDIGRKAAYFLGTGNLASFSGLDLQQMSGYTVVAERLNFYRFFSHFRSVHRGAFFAELKTTTVRKLMPESWGFFCPVHTPDGAPCGLLNHLTHTVKVVVQDFLTQTHENKYIESPLSGEFSMAEKTSMKLHPFLISSDIHSVLIHLGLCPPDQERLPFVWNGNWIGSLSLSRIPVFMRSIRLLKSANMDNIGKSNPWKNVEIIYPEDQNIVYLYSSPCRLMRPVLQTQTGRIEYIGLLEQPYLSISLKNNQKTNESDSFIADSSGSMLMNIELEEVQNTHILSVMANMTPFSDFNQSPRNMYQCQMGKQTMGTPAHAFPYRSDNKLFRLMTPQSPLVRPRLYEKYGLDKYPNGTNAIVAVLAYTGYDMEDAMIINKSAQERGFGMAEIYKTERIDLDTDLYKHNPSEGKISFFGCFDESLLEKGVLDMDGLPPIGVVLKNGDVLASVFNPLTCQHRLVKYKGFEDALVTHVCLLGDDDPKFSNAPVSGSNSSGANAASVSTSGFYLGARKVLIQLRMPRAPIIGDKFSSRHGQKGVCSQKYLTHDLPFTSESGGLVPDVIINPNAFPSRMTIGMFVELMAGKSATLHGLFQDATPWSFQGDMPLIDNIVSVGSRKQITHNYGIFEKNQVSSNMEYRLAYEYFGEQLKAAGYEYYGNETMYSGVTGLPLKVDIFIGCCYYQRLRHMVNDKFQVRTTGPIHSLTHQPIKGRKRAGGIRFGEMERDSLLAHGTAFLLHDRLMNCSDYTHMYVCKSCGSILSVLTQPVTVSSGSGTMPSSKLKKKLEPVCLECSTNTNSETKNLSSALCAKSGTKVMGSAGSIAVVALPYVLRYLAAELMAMNIKLRLHVK